MKCLRILNRIFSIIDKANIITSAIFYNIEGIHKEFRYQRQRRFPISLKYIILQPINAREHRIKCDKTGT